MRTQISNGYTISNSFNDGRTRISLTDILERIDMNPEFAGTVGRGYARLLEPDDGVVLEGGGDHWATEAQAYALLGCLRSSTSNQDVCDKAFREVIKAFVDARRRDWPDHAAQRLRCFAPGGDQMLTTNNDGSRAPNELAWIYAAVIDGLRNKLPAPFPEVLEHLVAEFSPSHGGFARRSN